MRRYYSTAYDLVRSLDKRLIGRRINIHSYCSEYTENPLIVVKIYVGNWSCDETEIEAVDAKTSKKKYLKGRYTVSLCPNETPEPLATVRIHVGGLSGERTFIEAMGEKLSRRKYRNGRYAVSLIPNPIIPH